MEIYEINIFCYMNKTSEMNIVNKSKYLEECLNKTISDDWITKIGKPNELIRNASRKLRTLIFEKDNYKCVYCSNSSNLEIDHIIPFSKGGKTTFNNLQVLCMRCNRKKSNK